MATLEYLVKAIDGMSGPMAKMALSADGLNAQLDDLDKKDISVPIGLKDDAKFKSELAQAAAQMDRLSAKKITPETSDVEIRRTQLALLRLQVQMDRLDAKRIKIHIETSGLGRLSKALSGAAGAGFLQPSVMGTALTLLPALIPLAAGVAEGVGAIGVSFGAAGAAAIGFGLVAKTVLTSASQDAKALAALNLKLNTATTKSAKDAVRAQISALKQGWTPAYRQVMTNLDALDQRWKITTIDIAAPAVATWLKAVLDGLKFIRPALEPVADVFRVWGETIDKYFKSGAGSTEVKKLATAFGQFSAGQLLQLGVAIKQMAEGVFNLAKDVGAGGANFYAFGGALGRWGAAFNTWSKSKAARDDVNAFVRYLKDNGGTVAKLVGELAKALPGIFAGASAVGQLELQALTSFLGFVNKLPPGFAKPLTELAGALLLLKSTGVIKVGLQLTGWAAAKGAAAGAAEGAAAAGGSAGLLTRATGLKWLIRGGIAFAAADIVIRVAASAVPKQPGSQVPTGAGGARAIAEKLFGPGIDNVAAWFDHNVSQPIRDSAKRNFHDVAASFDITRHSLSASFAVLRHDAATTGHDIAGAFDAARRKVALGFGIMRDVVKIALESIAIKALQTVVTILNGFSHIPGIGGKFKTAADLVKGQLTRMQRDTATATRDMQSKINALHGKHITVTETGTGTFKITGIFGKNTSSTPKLAGGAQGLFINRGTTPTADDVLVRASKGELIVPTKMVSAGLVDHLRGTIPGFAAGGLVQKSLPAIGQAALNQDKRFVDTFTKAMEAQITAETKAQQKIMNRLFSGGRGSQAIVRDAMQWIGRIPYVWGDTAVPGGADCSGFVETIYNRHGLRPPRTSEAQGAWVRRSNPTPGGLAFYVSPGGGPPPGHVAIVGNNGMAISQGGGLGPQYASLRSIAPLMFTGVPPHGFDKGGWLPQGLSLAWNRSGRPERVTSARGEDAQAARMDAMIARLDRLIAATERTGPARTGAAVAGALNGTARMAGSMR